MTTTKVVDWRVWKAATVAMDGPPVYPGWSRVKAGDHLYVITSLEKTLLGAFSFITPSPTSLALSVAISAARAGIEARKSLRIEPSMQAGQPGSLELKHLRELYAYFEHCMVAVTFSYQALEAFSNQVVEELVKGKHPVKRSNETKQWTAPEIERLCSTELKLGTILPELTQLSSPKGTKKWERLIALKDLRDSAVHLKSGDQYVRGKPSDNVLYSRFLNCQPSEFPKTAIAIIKHFSNLPEGQEWLAGAESLLADLA